MSFAALVPKLMWPTFFEEPVMLLAFVLLVELSRTGKLKASSDMSDLMNLVPSTCRLLLSDPLVKVTAIERFPFINQTDGYTFDLTWR